MKKAADTPRQGQGGAKPRLICCGHYVDRIFCRSGTPQRFKPVAWICLICGTITPDKAAFTEIQNTHKNNPVRRAGAAKIPQQGRGKTVTPICCGHYMYRLSCGPRWAWLPAGWICMHCGTMRIDHAAYEKIKSKLSLGDIL